MTYETLKRFAEGRYSWKEFLAVKSWFDRINDNDDVKRFLNTHFDELNNTSFPANDSLKRVYERVEYHILLEEKRASGRRRIWDYYRQVAAVFLVPVMALSLWYFFTQRQMATEDPSWVEIHAPNSGRIHFSLPDGSEGWLNNGSTLKYHPVFTKKRQVELTGEAWFKVLPCGLPFLVNTANMDISVLGTTFSVSSYPDDGFSHVVLTEGKVQVMSRNLGFDRVIGPGEKLTVYPAENKFNVKAVDTRLYTAWTKGLLVLDNEPLEGAVTRLERWYNANIIIEDKVLKGYRFKATFQDEPLEEVLKLLSLSTPIGYRFETREEDSYGIFKKKTVRLKLK